VNVDHEGDDEGVARPCNCRVGEGNETQEDGELHAEELGHEREKV